MILLALAVSASAVLVDPYRMYGTRPIQGLTAVKPAAYRNSSFVKEYLLERVKPRTLLLGNSRVEIGLDPASPLWPKDDQPVFNAAEAGHDLQTAAERLRLAMQVAPLRLVIVAADFPDFLEPHDLHPTGSINSPRLPFLADGISNPMRVNQLWKDRFVTALTVDALYDSIVTLIDQDPIEGVTMTSEGFNPLRQIAAAAKAEGYHALFAQKMSLYAAQFAAYPKPDFSEPLRHANFQYLDDIVRSTTRNGIHVIVFINPYHVTLLDLWREDGLWPGFESWKRALVHVVDQAAGSHRDLATILDFSGYSNFTAEPIPPSTDRYSAMRWYWEAGHFKRELGEKLIARMVGMNEAFGRELTAATINEALLDMRKERPLSNAVASSVTR